MRRHERFLVGDIGCVNKLSLGNVVAVQLVHHLAGNGGVLGA